MPGLNCSYDMVGHNKERLEMRKEKWTKEHITKVNEDVKLKTEDLER